MNKKAKKAETDKMGACQNGSLIVLARSLFLFQILWIASRVFREKREYTN